MNTPRPQPGSWDDLLREHASQSPNKAAFTFLPESAGPAQEVTYDQLLRRAGSAAAALAAYAARGRRALLLYDWGEDYLIGLYGCLMAGAVAVPVSVGEGRRGIGRLEHIVRDSEPVLALTCGRTLSRLRRELGSSAWSKGVVTLCTDDLEVPPATAVQPLATQAAILQYTSGSTARPKGVVLSWGNLWANQEAMNRAFKVTVEDVIVGWLPLYHDMGLIGTLLQATYAGATAVLMPPRSFVRDPLRWLSEVSRWRGTISGGPNSGYELCLAAARAGRMPGDLDLASWQVALNGSEAVQAGTLRDFAEAFAPYGFDARAFSPCYGLAEATLFVSGGGRRGAAPVLATVSRAGRGDGAGGGSRHVVSCGAPAPGHDVVIVDPASGQPCPPGRVGEIWVRGPSIAAGYLNREAESRAAFGGSVRGSGGFLKTGDLGFVRDGELFPTGRQKNVLVVGGRNHQAEDLEETASRSHDAFWHSAAAAFALEEGSDTGFGIVQEIPSSHLHAAAAAARATAAALAAEHQVSPRAVVLVRRGTLPRTTSGKVMRAECARRFREGKLSRLHQWPEASAAGAGAEAAPSVLDEEMVVAILTELVGAPASEVLDKSLVSLGLDSLRAMEISAALTARFGVGYPATELLRGATGREVVRSLAGGGVREGSRAQTSRRLVPSSPERPLASGEEGLWLREQGWDAGDVNTLARAYRLGGVTPDSLLAALRRLARRHPSLSAVLARGDGESLQVRVEAEGQPAVAVFAAEDWSEDAVWAEVRQKAAQRFEVGDRLFRAAVWKRSARSSVVLFSMNHLAIDLWSAALLLDDLLRELESPSPAELAPPASFEAFLAHQQSAIEPPAGDAALEYWRARLVPASPARRLRPDEGARAAEGAVLDAVPIDWTPAFSVAVRAAAAREGVTPYALCLAALQVLLQRCSGETDLAVTILTSGRWDERWRNVVGYCVNPVMIRMDVDPRRTIGAHLRLLQARLTEDYRHSDTPFAWLVRRLGPQGRAVAEQAQEVICSWQSAGGLGRGDLSALALNRTGARISRGVVSLEAERLGPDPIEHELALMLVDDGVRIRGECRYRRRTFLADTVAGIVDGWTSILGGFIEDPDRRLEQLPLARVSAGRVSPPPAVPAPPGDELVCLHQAFAAHARRAPERLAVSCGGTELSYGELDRRAGLLAQALRGAGVGPEQVVALLLARSVDLVVGVVGITRSGGAYLPLEPEWPEDRLAHVMRDSGVRVIVQSRNAGYRWLPAGVTQICIEDLGAGSGDDGAGAAEIDSLCYVIYTSGSTGQPKGVAVAHRQVAALLRAGREVFEWGPGDRWAMSHSIAFDFSVWEIWGALTSGGSVVVVPFEVIRDPEAYRAVLAAREVSVLSITPSLFRHLTRADGEASDRLGDLRAVIFGGEALQLPALRPWLARYGDERPLLVNMYGITETTVHVTHRRIRTSDAEAPGGNPIGRPLPQTEVHVLDDRLHALPDGLEGELCVGGTGVARGYFRRPDLTAERFVPDPTANPPGGRLYRSGDRGRYLANGELEYLGRRDQQVKLRGYRVEAAEIEAALSAHPSVAECAVITRRGQEGLLLVGFVSGAGTRQTDLRRHLRRQLPGYMVPAQIVWLPRLPVTMNGKVDRSALANLELPEPSDRPADAAAPVTTTERALQQIWAEVLERGDMGLDENFFDLGGHSLSVVQVLSRISQHFGIAVPIARFFDGPTLRGLARVVEELGASPLPAAGPVDLAAAFDRLSEDALERLVDGEAE